MKTKTHAMTVLIAMMMVFITGSSSLTAQSIWLSNNGGKSISFEGFKPIFDEEGYSFSTGTYFLGFRIPIGKSLLVAELPYVHAAYKLESPYFNMSLSESGIGNPYIGLQQRISNSSTFGEVGLRIPLAPEDKWLANMIGIYSDLDRQEAFVPHWLPITAMLNYLKKSNAGLIFRLRGGPLLWINTEKSEFDDSIELLMKYSAQIGYESGQVRLLGGLVGRMIVTEGDLDISERTAHQLGFSASVGFGNVRPGFLLLLPLDEEMKDVTNYVLGVNVEVTLP